MLNRKSAASRSGAWLRKRYGDIEPGTRVEMLQHLASLGGRAHVHPAFKRASTLLSRGFHKASGERCSGG